MDGEIKILNRFVDFTRHLTCNGSIAVGLGIIRSQADGMIKVGDCLIVFATDKAKASAIEICGGITWVALNSLSIVRNCFVVLASYLVYISSVVESQVCNTGVMRDGLAEIRDRAGIIAFFHQRQTTVNIRAAI